MRLVLDTNVVASALLWGGKPHASGALRYSPAPRCWPNSRTCSAGASLRQRSPPPGSPLSNWSSALLAAPVHPAPIPRTVRDPDDDAVLATALAARADVIATGDQDLRVLHPWQGIRILNAGEALRYALGTDEQIRG